MDGERETLAEIVWEGDSLARLRAFPMGIRQDFGAELFRLQRGEKPLNSRPMKSIGRGVYELRQCDQATWYRVIYLAKVGNRIYVLHSFRKRSRKTPRKDIQIAGERLTAVRRKIAEEK